MGEKLQGYYWWARTRLSDAKVNMRKKIRDKDDTSSDVVVNDPNVKKSTSFQTKKLSKKRSDEESTIRMRMKTFSDGKGMPEWAASKLAEMVIREREKRKQLDEFESYKEKILSKYESKAWVVTGVTPSIVKDDLIHTPYPFQKGQINVLPRSIRSGRAEPHAPKVIVSSVHNSDKSALIAPPKPSNKTEKPKKEKGRLKLLSAFKGSKDRKERIRRDSEINMHELEKKINESNKPKKNEKARGKERNPKTRRSRRSKRKSVSQKSAREKCPEATNPETEVENNPFADADYMTSDVSTFGALEYSIGCIFDGEAGTSSQAPSPRKNDATSDEATDGYGDPDYTQLTQENTFANLGLSMPAPDDITPQKLPRKRDNESGVRFKEIAMTKDFWYDSAVECEPYQANLNCSIN